MHKRSSRSSARQRRWLEVVIVFACCASGSIHAQDEPAPAAEKKGVRITFLPPPLEGTLSLGVYTREGKLARVLAREATEEQFTVGLNGLITHWDGKDDAGKPLPPGKYAVRGYAVGDLGSDGVAFHANDWIVDENSARPTGFGEMRVAGGELLLVAIAGNTPLGVMHVDLATQRLSLEPLETEKPAPPQSPAAAELMKIARGLMPELPKRVQVPGKGGSTWTIETVGEGADARRVVAQRAGEETLRALEIEPQGPQPISIAAAPERDEIFLLEENAQQVRVRGLRLRETVAAENGRKVSSWEIFLSKSIWKCDSYAAFAALFPRKTPFAPEEKLAVKLVANPLIQTEPATLHLGVGIDETGSFLRAADGLPLIHVTDTPGLKWSVLGREAGSKALTIFQSDGAVVEEFQIAKPSNIMAFDAGEYARTAASLAK